MPIDGRFMNGKRLIYLAANEGRVSRQRRVARDVGFRASGIEFVTLSRGLFCFIYSSY